MTPDVWSEGAWDRVESAARLGISGSAFDRIDRQEPFPHRWVRGKKVFSRVAILAFLAGSPETPPEGVRRRVAALAK